VEKKRNNVTTHSKKETGSEKKHDQKEIGSPRHVWNGAGHGNINRNKVEKQCGRGWKHEKIQ